jgi:hypothetical protein
MARTARVPYLVSGTNEYRSANLGRGTAAVAVKLARKLLREGYMNVKVCTPQGRLLQPDELCGFEQPGERHGQGRATRQS